MTMLVDLVLLLVALVTSPVWFIRMACRGRLRTDWRGRFGCGPTLGPPPSRGRIVLHAVSVGEVGALRDLVAQLELEEELDLVVASTTDTGVQRAAELFGDRHAVVRWPLDLSWSVRRFLNRMQPTVVGLVELELWPNMTRVCARRGIDTVIVSGRLSRRSVARYRLILAAVRWMFRQVAALGAQTDEVARRFESLGVRPEVVSVTGNMKWDSVRFRDAPDEQAQALRDALGIDPDRVLVVGGSTAPGEEAMLRAAIPDGVQLLCAPRRPEWWDHAAEVLAPCVRRTTGDGDPASGRFLLDTIGELSLAYMLADIVVVGRSFGDLHGSDPIEPIAMGAATVIGPRDEDFSHAVDALRHGEGLIQVDADALPGVLSDLVTSDATRRQLVERGRLVIAGQQGATARNAALLVRSRRGG